MVNAMKSSTVMMLVAVGLFVKSVEPCSEEMIKEMAVMACAMRKRSSNPEINTYRSAGRKFGVNSWREDDVQREYGRPVGDVHEEELFLNKKDDNNPTEYRLARRKRDIIALAKECCYRKCTVNDFMSICD